MAINTGIQWCDSTGNPQMGCEGCELRKGKRKTCYAGSLTDRYQGLKGWPVNFETPKLFLERMPKILNYSDLTGTDRPDKPWLNGMPRIIFLNDMGDTFTKGLPNDWFAELLPAIAKSPHQFLVLTKWPKRFMQFSLRYDLPKNVWPGTSITNQKTQFRAWELDGIIGGGPKFVSFEPLRSNIDYAALPKSINWAIFGGESGREGFECDVHWIKNGLDYCKQNSISAFVKQLGSKPILREGVPYTWIGKPLKDGHGGDSTEWGESLRVREMPKLSL